MGRNVATLSLLPETTDLRQSFLLATSAEWCSPPQARGRRWWIVDLDVRAEFEDTVPASWLTPGVNGLRDYRARSPLHVAIEYTVLTPTESFAHRRVIDAIPGRYAVFASTVNLSVLAPANSVAFDLERPGRPPAALRSTETLVSVVSGGIAPAGDVDGLSPGEGSSQDASFTFRLAPDSAADPRVPIPAGARTVQIFDSTMSDWQWNSPTYGVLPTTVGHSDVLEVPTSLYVAPTDLATRRATSCVFGVHL